MRSEPPAPETDSTSEEDDEQQQSFFWMPAAARPVHITTLQQEPGSAFLRNEAHEIARRIESIGSGRFVPKQVRQWSELVMQDQHPNGAAGWLTRAVRELVAHGSTGDALDLLGLGGELAPILGGTLQGTVARGNRWVELVYRRIQDERMLKDFVSRKDEIVDLEELLQPSTPHWALHYVGPGGVGKSMLVRYITAKVAVERKIAVARIDFDHLSPDYPLRRPGQLLSALVDELQSYSASSRQDMLIEEFQNRVLKVHEAISGSGPFRLLPESEALVSIEQSEFQEVLKAFCDLLRPLPEPVLLILDTCEELARLSPSSAMLPSLIATFKILEFVQKEVTSVRVIFAGRRLLALSGEELPDKSAGWTADDATITTKRHLPAHKPYLRLHQLQGFGRQDAENLLRNKTGRDVGPTMRDAILLRSPEIGTAIKIRRHGPVVPDGGVARYNPFDVALYGDWLHENPELTPEEISEGADDPYVELRIVARIKHRAVRSVLPAAVLLRRFDGEMLAPAVPPGTVFEDVFRELGDMEWLSYQRDEALGTTFLEADRNFYKRVWDYFNAPTRRWEIAAATRSLAWALACQVRDQPLRQLGVDRINSALRLLPAGEAAALWADIEYRIPAEADWTWARTVTERLLGEDGAAGMGDADDADKATWKSTATRLLMRHVDYRSCAMRSGNWSWIQHIWCSGPALLPRRSRRPWI
jgi:hypothetical protein